MKKYLYVVVLILATFMVSCSNNEEITDSSVATQSSSVEISVSSKPTTTPASGQISVITELSAENIDLIQVGDPIGSFEIDNTHWWTVSVTEEGKQCLYQDYLKSYSENLYDLKDITEQVAEEKEFMYIPASEYYDENSTGYKERTIEKYICRTTGQRAPIVSKVKYINHHITPGYIKSYWEKTFKEEISKAYNRKYSKNNEVSVDTPIVFERSWSFYHGEKLIEIVIANNLDYSIDGKLYKNAADCKIKPDNPTGDNLVVYEAALIFVDGKLAKNDGITVVAVDCFDYADYGEYYFTDNYKCYQYDTNGNVVLCQMFMTADYNFREMIYTDNYAYLDLDGDSIGEILCNTQPYSTSWGISGVVSYKIEDDAITPSMTCLETAVTIY